jgi:cell division septation protein DedD
MPRTLELGLNRIFRSRWGVAVILVVVVLAVVGLGRLLSGGDPSAPPLVASSPAPVISADPHDDDSVIDTAPPPSPTTSKGQAQPEAVAYAFASAWVDHQNVSPKTWRDRLLPNCTKTRGDELEGVDPAGVPADRVRGRPSLVPVSATLVNAVVTMDTGKLTLRMISPDGHWVVDGIDWDTT